MASKSGESATEEKQVITCEPGFLNFLKMCSDKANESVHLGDVAVEDRAWYEKLTAKKFGATSAVHIDMLFGLFITPGFDQGDIMKVLKAVVACLVRNGLTTTYQLPEDVVAQMREHIVKLPRIPDLADDQARKPLNRVTCEEGLVPFLELCAQNRHLKVTEQDGDQVKRDWFGKLMLRYFEGAAVVTIDELLALFVRKGFNHSLDDLVLLLLLARLKRMGLDPDYELPPDAGELLQEHLNPDEELEAAS